MAREIRFVSSNPHKLQEAHDILGPMGITVLPFTQKIDEIQTADQQKLVRHKVIEAFKSIGRPVFVEHTGLYLSYLCDLPGGLTQLFWDALQADRFATIFGKSSDPKVVARTLVGYLDGRAIHTFEGEIKGTIVGTPRGPRDFQWDCVFQPDGETRTFAEMGSEKNQISMRRKALDAFGKFLK